MHLSRAATRVLVIAANNFLLLTHKTSYFLRRNYYYIRFAGHTSSLGVASRYLIKGIPRFFTCLLLKFEDITISLVENMVLLLGRDESAGKSYTDTARQTYLNSESWPCHTQLYCFASILTRLECTYTWAEHHHHPHPYDPNNPREKVLTRHLLQDRPSRLNGQENWPSCILYDS